jgi:hypothetical protein
MGFQRYLLDLILGWRDDVNRCWYCRVPLKPGDDVRYLNVGGVIDWRAHRACLDAGGVAR